MHLQQEVWGEATRNRASSKENPEMPDLIHGKCSLTEIALSISNRTPFPTRVKKNNQKKLSKPAQKNNCFGKNLGESSYSFSVWFWGCFAHFKREQNFFQNLKIDML